MSFNSLNPDLHLSSRDVSDIISCLVCFNRIRVSSIRFHFSRKFNYVWKATIYQEMGQGAGYRIFKFVLDNDTHEWTVSEL